MVDRPEGLSRPDRVARVLLANLRRPTAANPRQPLSVPLLSRERRPTSTTSLSVRGPLAAPRDA
jgi:hypothetical protein